MHSGVLHINTARQVHVAFDTIEWPGGIDLDPEFVRKHCVLSNQKHQHASK